MVWFRDDVDKLLAINHVAYNKVGFGLALSYISNRSIGNQYGRASVSGVTVHTVSAVFLSPRAHTN